MEIATSIKYLSRVDPIKFSSLKPTFIDSIQENKQIEAKKLAKLKEENTGPGDFFKQAEANRVLWKKNEK